MTTGDGPLQVWGLSHSINEGWRTYYSHITLTPGETPEQCLDSLRKAYSPPLSDHVANKRLRIRLVSVPTLGSHDAVVVWQATDDDAAKDFLTYALAKLSTSATLLHALASGTHG
jgi:hypothetical protein